MCSSIRRQLATAREPNSVQCDRGRLPQSHCSEWITINSAQNQLAHLTSLPQYQLAPLILPTRPTSTTNSSHVVCQLAQFSDQLAPTFTNSPHFSYQLAPRTSLTNSPHFSDQVGCVYDALITLINQNKL